MVVVVVSVVVGVWGWGDTYWVKAYLPHYKTQGVGLVVVVVVVVVAIAVVVVVVVVNVVVGVGVRVGVRARVVVSVRGYGVRGWC